MKLWILVFISALAVRLRIKTVNFLRYLKISAWKILCWKLMPLICRPCLFGGSEMKAVISFMLRRKLAEIKGISYRRSCKDHYC